MDVVFLDLAKAFNKVPHKRLIEKLQEHGIGGRLKCVTESWLANRRQRKGVMSGRMRVLSGVPQGSVLGALLFIVYTNDLDTGLINELLKFADDMKVFGKVTDGSDRESIQEDLNRLVNWADRWKMEFNAKKCKLMHVGRDKVNFKYTMKGNTLQETSLEKDLGVVISDDGKTLSQCQYVYKKAIRIFGMINRTIKYKERRIMVRLYKSLVRATLRILCECMVSSLS